MLRSNRSRLARFLAAAAASGAMLAMAPLGQLPAQATYAPTAPPPPTTAPGGYVNVLTSRTIGPAGGVIGPVRAGGLRFTLIVARHTFHFGVQITLTQADLRAIGDAGHRGHQAIGGVGVLVQRHGATLTGQYAQPLRLLVSGPPSTPGVPVAVWAGTQFRLIPARVTRHTLRIKIYSGTEQDFVVLAPARRHGHRQVATTAARRPGHRDGALLTGVFLSPAGGRPAGFGVLAPRWLTAH